MQYARRYTAAAAALILLVAAAPAAAQTPKVFYACYVPASGAVYRIKEPGLPQECGKTGQYQHIEFSWTDGVPAPIQSGDAAGGDLAGTYPNPSVAKLQGQAVSTDAPSASGQVLTWDGSQWAPANAAAGVTDHGRLDGLTDDDHPQYLLGDGVRSTTNGFAVTGTRGMGSIPVGGAGTRLMWYSGKAAFRAGAVTGDQWDDSKIGNYSTALGGETTASGHLSTAMGGVTTASGHHSTAMGGLTTASGDYSTAMGRSTTAQARNSLAIGQYNVVEGDKNNWVATDPLLVAGNGSSFASRSNALTLLKNGNLTIAGTLAQASDIRLKEEVEPVADALERVLQLTPIRYRFKEGTGHPSEPKLGLSAQEVERLFPELVRRGADGYLSVAYPELSAVLVRALQEQQQEIERLSAEHAELQRRLARLEAARER